jgi:hypothetical protein
MPAGRILSAEKKKTDPECGFGFTPAYELRTPRRERWLDPVDGAEQHVGNRT